MSKEPYNLARYRTRAERMLEQPARLLKLGTRAADKLDGESANARLSQVREQLATMLALLKAWLVGDYRGVSRKALLGIAAALAYFVNPFDAIPDFLLGLGLIDDVAVIGYVIKQVQHELEAFKRWQMQQATSEQNSAETSESGQE